MNRGLLLTMTEPPPGMEDEFNAWYDSEHLAERLAISGFRSAQRWVADVAPGEGKYLATYELDSPQVLTTPEYLTRLGSPTPWTKRCLDKAVVFRRWTCEQADPGDADPHPLARFVLLALSDAALKIHVSDALQVRHFLASSGEPPHILLGEFASELSLPELHQASFIRSYRIYGA
jgi:hypothetical protein